MSGWPDVVPHFVTRCLYHGVHLSSGQLDLCQYYFWAPDTSTMGYIWLKVSLGQRLTKCQGDLMLYHSLSLDVNWPYVSTILGHQIPLPGGYVWAQANWTYVTTILGHQVPLPEGYIWAQVNATYVCTHLGQQMPLPGAYVWLNVSLTQRITKCQDDLT